MQEQMEFHPSTLLPLTAAEVFERYAETVYRLAFLRTKSCEDAEDLLQEVFVRYIRSDPKFSEEEHRKAWFIRVTLRCSANLMSSAWMRRTVPLDETKHDIPETTKTDYSDVYEAVMQLPAKYRTVVHLFYYESYSVTEIAELCGMVEATVKTHLYRAREKLRKKLGEFNRKADHKNEQQI